MKVLKRREVVEDPPELLPLRAINEFVYCPRLFFIEHVERQFEESHDTVDGARVHARVDKPKGQITSREDDATSVTSLELSSERLGITGKLDLVRIEGDQHVPVDYKRGVLPPPEIGVYDPERVQVILQALLLREHGYTCNEGRIYFAASKRHVSIVIDEAAEALALRAIEDARVASRRRQLPPPLVDSPKCGRCSLNVICLPDETNALNATTLALPVRPFAPPIDDRRALYVVTPGARVGLAGEVLQVKTDEGVVAESRLFETAHISLFGNVQISSQAARAVLGRDIPIFYLSYGGWLSGYARSIDDHSLDLREAQMRLPDSARFAIARAIVEGKVRNQRTMVRRLSGSARALQALALCLHRVRLAADIATLLGLEGRAAQIYFRTLAGLLQKDAFDFTRRNRRPPGDPVNALLSFGYAMLAKEALAAVLAVGFEPGVGVYHSRRPGRPSLALDLMEEFRPLIVDSTVLSVINTSEIRANHFIDRGLGVSLTEDGRRIFIRAMERRLQSVITHPVFEYEASYRRSLWLQARLLARTIQGDLEKYPPFVTR